MKKYNILYMTNIPAPYRIDFFNELGKNCNLTVSFDCYINDKQWKERRTNWLKKNDNESFQTIFLKEKSNSNIKALRNIKKIINNKNIDVVIIGEYSAKISILLINYLKKKKIPIIINSDGGFPRKNENIIKRLLKKYLINRGDYFITTGNNGIKYLKYYGVKKQIDTYSFTTLFKKDIVRDQINKEKLKKELNISERFVFIFIGQYIYRKGIDILIEACDNLPKDIGVYILGDNPTHEFDSLIEKCNKENIHFISFQNKDYVKKYCEASDVFIFPTREDIWGLVVVEALSYGLPVITTKKCGAGLDLIKNNQNGFIINDCNAKELKKTMNYCFTNPNIIHQMSEKSKKMMNDYTIEKSAKEHMNIIKKILGGIK